MGSRGQVGSVRVRAWWGLALLALGACARATNEVRQDEVRAEAGVEARSEGPLGGGPRAPAEAGARELGDPYTPGLGNGGYDVEHYDLGLDLDMAAEELVADVSVRARALQDLASFSLDLYGLAVSAVALDGQEVRFERARAPGAPEDAPPSELVVHPAQPIPAGTAFTARIRYSGRPDGRPDPSVPFLPRGVGWSWTDSGVYVVSECIGASSWFPCNDHPRDKATYTFRVTVEEPYTAAANGLLAEAREEGGRRTFLFEARDPMASYLATLNVAEFDVLEAAGPRGIPMRIYHPSDATEEELAPFRSQGEVLAFLETLFGPYPFEAAGGVLAYERIGGALECQTLPVYGRDAGGALVHELAHQWFGDCVSPDLWRDMWLNEGFASYAEWLWEEHLGGEEAYLRRARRAYAAVRRGKLGSPFDPGVGRVFSGRVYTRGALVLHGLRAEVGAETLMAILRGWVERHHDGNGSTAGFVQHASAVAGRDLGPFFEAWLFAPETPLVPAWEPLEEAGAPRRAEEEPSDGAGGH
jgi:aminopeptidase N